MSSTLTLCKKASKSVWRLQQSLRKERLLASGVQCFRSAPRPPEPGRRKGVPRGATGSVPDGRRGLTPDAARRTHTQALGRDCPHQFFYELAGRIPLFGSGLPDKVQRVWALGRCVGPGCPRHSPLLLQ